MAYRNGICSINSSETAYPYFLSQNQNEVYQDITKTVHHNINEKLAYKPKNYSAEHLPKFYCRDDSGVSLLSAQRTYSKHHIHNNHDNQDFGIKHPQNRVYGNCLIVTPSSIPDYSSEIHQIVLRIKIRRGDLISNIVKFTTDYAGQFIESLFDCKPTPIDKNNTSLEKFMQNIITRTRINTQTVIMAFLYLDRLKFMHPKCKGSTGSCFRLMMASLILASKYSYVENANFLSQDDTYDNTAWATVSSGLFELNQINHVY